MTLKQDRNFEVIAAHSEQARYYKFRTPYLASIFYGLKTALALTERSVLLDLCCGCGEVADGIKGHVGHVHAVDGSAEMLAHAPENQKISYYEADVNKEPIQLPEVADHLLIGRALHWIEEEPLRRIISDNLKEDAHAVILSAQWSGQDEWVQQYRALVLRYWGNTASDRQDFSGIEKMKKLGFDFHKRIESKAMFSMNINYLLGYTLANSYGDNHKNIIKNIKKFKDDLENILNIFLADGIVSTEISSWAAVYRMVR